MNPISLYNHSCERMHELADGSVSLIVTSPPYFINPKDELMQPVLLRGEGHIPATYEALLETLGHCFAECFRVLKPGGFLAVIVANTLIAGKLYPLPYDLALRLIGQGYELKEELIWRRWRGWDRRAGNLIQKPYPGHFFPNRLHETVLVLKKPGPAIYENRTDKEREDSRIDIDDLYTKEVSNSVWNILPITPANKGSHPAPYPEELAYRLITLYSYAGETVLDPFTGTGTTGKVAHLLGRAFVGYEINPEFIPVATARMAERFIRRQRRITRFVRLPDSSPITKKATSPSRD